MNQEYFTIIRWHKEDLKDKLESNGIPATEENISIALNSRLPKTLEECSIQAGHEMLDDLICGMKDQFSNEAGYLTNLTKEDICRRYNTLEKLCEDLDTCFDLHDLGYSDEITQKNYIELSEMTVLELWYTYKKAKGENLDGIKNYPSN